MSALEVKNLSVHLNGLKVLDSVSFAIEDGDFLMVLGPNGAGKSVLLKSILGLLPYEGEVRIFGQNVDKVRSKIGYVPQYVDFDRTFPLTVTEVVRLNQVRTKFSDEDLQQILATVGLGQKQKSFFGSLSGGQIKRTLIARALVGRPEMLILDEPLAGVDLVGEKSFYEILASWHQQMKLTTIMVSHDYSLVSKVATKVLCLNNKKVCFGPAAEMTEAKFEKTFGGQVSMHIH